MVRYSRRNRRGGDKFYDILSDLDNIKRQINELRESKSTTTIEESVDEEPIIEKEESIEKEEPIEEKIVKSWVDDKNKKFKDGAGGRVTLSFSRIITLLDNNINKGNDKKDWSAIKKELNDAKSVDEVQDIINKYKISFSSNFVAGTRKKRRGGKRRTHRRY